MINTISSHLYMELKKKSNSQKPRLEWWLPESRGNGKMLVNWSSYNNLLVVRWVSSGDLIYSVVTIINDTVLHNWNCLRVDVKCSHHTDIHTHTHTHKLCEDVNVLISLTVVIISQCLCVSNHHIKYIYIFHLSITSQ